MSFDRQTNRHNWAYSLELPRHFDPRRRRLRRGGYRSAQDAIAARDRLIAAVPGRAGHAVLTVADWLEIWLETRARLRDSTLRGYRTHVYRYLVPAFGHLLLADVSVRHIQQAFARLLHSQTISAATTRRVHCTLRSALNSAQRESLIADNPARYLKLPRGRRPHAVVWNDRLINRWRLTGTRPVVAVWTPALTAQFLESIHDHRLYAVFHLIAIRGLRRGEAAGLRWCDLDLEADLAHLTWQIQLVNGTYISCPLKTETSRRTVALDAVTVRELRRHRHRQQEELRANGSTPSGYVFTNTRGQPISPQVLTQTFRKLVAEADLPPVRLHDLRHGAATLALQAGVDLKTISDQLGHSSIVLTADTYISVTAQHALHGAEAVARLILEAGQRPPGSDKKRRPLPRPHHTVTVS